MASLIDVTDVAKSFEIPSDRRQTVRDHVFGLLRRRKFERLQVLDGISFSVEPGQSLGIMGRNGSGKSTLLKILCGIFRPDRGQVTVRAPLTPILELGLGWNAELDAVDNILLIATAMGLSLSEAKKAVDPVLAFAGLERFANLELKHYSTGMAARLSYAVAFHAVRDVLVLDEVLAVGDAGFQARCEARYRQLIAEGRTGVLVSHGPSTITDFCKSALLIEKGKIVAQGAPADVVAAYLQTTTGAQP
jgi:ABC-type polysaccharide/polyol phosphate transport system ATPase subunit